MSRSAAAETAAAANGATPLSPPQTPKGVHFNVEYLHDVELDTLPRATTGDSYFARSTKQDAAAGHDHAQHTPTATALSSRRASADFATALADATDRVELLGADADVTDRPQNQMQDRPAIFPSLTRELMFVGVCSAAQLCVQSNYGQGMGLMLELQAGLGLADTQLAWIIAALALANGSFVIVFGALADRIGGRRVFFSGAIWMALWTLVCGLSRSGSAFIAARAMQGIAGGALIPAAINILGNVYEPGRRKNRAFSAFGSMAPIGFIVGLLESGIITRFASWRVVFYASAVIYVFFAAAVLYCIPSDETLSGRPLLPIRQAMKGFDWLGSCTAVSGLVLIVFGLTDGPVVSWAPYTYSLLVVGVLVLVIFVMVEKYVAASPIMPLEIWRTPSFAALMVASVFGWGGFAAWQWIAALFWLRVENASVLSLAAYFLPNGIVGVLATFACAATLHILPGHVIFAVSCLCFGAGPGIMLPLTWQPQLSYWYTGMFAVSLATLGPDLAFASASVFITSSVKRKHAGTAGSLVNTVFNVSMSVFTGIGGIVESGVAEARKNKAIAAGASAGDWRPAIEDTLVSYRAVWWFALSASLVSFLVTVCFVRISKTHEKKHIE